MSQGFLLFAHDNERISYGLLAVWCARRIHQYLDRPVSLVSDAATVENLIKQGIDIKIFDRIIASNSNTRQVKRYQDELLTFNNLDRTNAWELTPYNETKIIDTDIVIQSNKLNLLWNNDHDYLVCKQSKEVFGYPSLDFEWVSSGGIPFYWATEFYFRKTAESKLFFDTCKWVKKNYGWLSVIYGYDPKLVRNDYLWSIALHTLGGTAHANWAPTIPGTLLYTVDKSYLLSMTADEIIVATHDELNVCRVQNQDVHVMNKNHLQRLVKQELGVNDE
jgi:hypothetical protein